MGMWMTGCGAGGAPTGPTPAEATAPSPTISPPSPSALQAVKGAAASTLSLSAAVTFDFAGLSTEPIVGQGTFDFAAATGRARILQPSGTETVVYQPTVVFDRPPPQEAVALPRGKTWFFAEPSEHVDSASSFTQFVLDAESKNPAFVLAELAWGTASAAPLGSRVVDARPATGYLAMVDLTAAAEGASGPAATAFSATIRDEEQALGTAPQAATPELPVRLWIDSEGRVVRFQAAQPESGTATYTVTVRSFGVAVDPSVPSKSDAFDLSSLAPGGDNDND